MTTTPVLHTLSLNPRLAGLVDRAQGILPPEAMVRVQAGLTTAEEIVSEVVDGLDFWLLTGSDELWARSRDVASLLEINPRSMSERITHAVSTEEISKANVRHGVRDDDVHKPISGATAHCLTTSPRGVTMLSLRTVKRLMMTASGERGVRFRHQLEAMLDHWSELERLVVDLLAEVLQPQPAQAPGARLRELELQVELARSKELGLRRDLPHGRLECMADLAPSTPQGPQPQLEGLLRTPERVRIRLEQPTAPAVLVVTNRQVRLTLALFDRDGPVLERTPTGEIEALVVVWPTHRDGSLDELATEAGEARVMRWRLSSVDLERLRKVAQSWSLDRYDIWASRQKILPCGTTLRGSRVWPEHRIKLGAGHADC